MGTMLLIRIINSNFKGKIFPIHLKLDTVLGYTAYKIIAEVPEVPDLVIIVLPPKVVPQVFKECGEKGVKKIVLISGGFRELVRCWRISQRSAKKAIQLFDAGIIERKKREH